MGQWYASRWVKESSAFKKKVQIILGKYKSVSLEVFWVEDRIKIFCP